MRIDSIEIALASLRQDGWFSLLQPAVQERIAANAKLLYFEKNDTIFNVGEPGDGLYGLVEGIYDVLVPRGDGELVPVMRMTPGYWLGDLAAIVGEPGLITMEAPSDLTLINVPARQLLKMLENDPSMYRVFYLISRQNIALCLRVMSELVVGKSDYKTIFRLLLLDELNGSKGAWIELSQTDLAFQLGLSPPSIQRSLKQCSDQGLIELGYGRVRIKDRQGLISILS